jgi:hypothetical protein
MFYLWERPSGKTSNFFSCIIDSDNIKDWLKINWFKGERITIPLPNVLTFHAENMLPPPDFPFTLNAIKLVSKKIKNILDAHGEKNIDYYESQIIRPDGSVIKDYYTINILNVVDCLDLQASKYIVEEYGPNKIMSFKSISLFNDKVPSEVKVFRIPQAKSLIFVRESIKDGFEEQGVTGVNLRPIHMGEKHFFNIKTMSHDV